MSENLIASRVYYHATSRQPYKLEIYAPYYLNDELKNWRCLVKITGDSVPEGLDSIEVGGVDSFQAPTLELIAAKGTIEALNKNFLNSELRFLNEAGDDLTYRLT